MFLRFACINQVNWNRHLSWRQLVLREEREMAVPCCDADLNPNESRTTRIIRELNAFRLVHRKPEFSQVWKMNERVGRHLLWRRYVEGEMAVTWWRRLESEWITYDANHPRVECFRLVHRKLKFSRWAWELAVNLLWRRLESEWITYDANHQIMRCLRIPRLKLGSSAARVLWGLSNHKNRQTNPAWKETSWPPRAVTPTFFFVQDIGFGLSRPHQSFKKT